MCIIKSFVKSSIFTSLSVHFQNVPVNLPTSHSSGESLEDSFDTVSCRPWHSLTSWLILFMIGLGGICHSYILAIASVWFGV